MRVVQTLVRRQRIKPLPMSMQGIALCFKLSVASIAGLGVSSCLAQTQVQPHTQIQAPSHVQGAAAESSKPNLLAGASAASQTKTGANPDRLGAFLDQLSGTTHVTLEVASALTDKVLQTAQNMASVALSYLGVPYRYGGNSAEQGLDCSGFVRLVYEQTAGLKLPRRSEEMNRLGSPVSTEDLQAGDLVFYNTLRRPHSHVGIYIGDGQFVHAPSSGGQVRVEKMAATYWQKRFDGAKRMVDAPSGEKRQ